MFKSARAREGVFTATMWLVSIVLAVFLIGFGGLVIGDLPRVSDPVTIEQFVDPTTSARLNAEDGKLQRLDADIGHRLEKAEQALTDARNNDATAQASFNNWISTRTATTDKSQDPEVLTRTRDLDNLKGIERAAEQARDQISAEQMANNRAIASLGDERTAMNARAAPRFEQARFLQELRVFGLRLAFTLPLLAVATLFLLQKNKGDYWPLKRGFVLFAAYAFFVELAPYLPEYGGYVRYGVGIVLTILVSHFVIKWMRNYLKTREVSETKGEGERKKSIQYDEALKKLAAHACPGCDRPLAPTTDAPTDYCMHCGMHLFNHCATCDSRKFAFFRFCMKCGAPAQDDAAAHA